MKKLYVGTLVLAGVLIMSCAGKKSNGSMADGAKIYKQNCMICHGADGKLGANGSKDLTASTMSLEERKAIIKNGKGAMVGLGSLLSQEEIDAVAAYTFKLK